jgi:hypothetical protein
MTQGQQTIPGTTREQPTDGGHSNARSAVYTPGTGWSTPVNVGNTGHIIDPALAVAPNGNAAAAWQQDLNGVSNLWANLFE